MSDNTIKDELIKAYKDAEKWTFRDLFRLIIDAEIEIMDRLDNIEGDDR